MQVILLLQWVRLLESLSTILIWRKKIVFVNFSHELWNGVALFQKKKEKRKKYFLKDVENFNFEQTRIKVRVLLHERLSLLYRLDWFNNVVYMNIEWVPEIGICGFM